MPRTPERGVPKTCFRICPENGAEWSEYFQIYSKSSKINTQHYTQPSAHILIKIDACCHKKPALNLKAGCDCIFYPWLGGRW